MNKCITITAYNRADYLQEVFKSLLDQNVNMRDYGISLMLDGPNLDSGSPENLLKCREVLNESYRFLTKQYKRFQNISVTSSFINKGINANTFDAVNSAFREGADYVIYLEDDFVLSRDAFSLVEWYINLDQNHDFGDKEIGAYCLCNIQAGTGDPGSFYLSRRFIAWGFVINKKQYEKYFKPAWFPEVGMFDNSIADHIRDSGSNVFNILPNASRVRNIGVEGMHFNKEIYEKLMKGFKFHKGGPVKYNLLEEIDYAQDKKVPSGRRYGSDPRRQS